MLPGFQHYGPSEWVKGLKKPWETLFGIHEAARIVLYIEISLVEAIGCKLE